MNGLFVSLIAITRLLITATDGAVPSQRLTVQNDSKLEDFMFVLENPTRIVPQNDSSGEQVDCFGLGKILATALEWFFKSNANGPNALDVQFQLVSRKQPQRVYVVPGEQFGLEWTDFRIERRTIIIVHGFLSHGQETWISDMANAFLEWGDVNIVIVDWSAGGNTWNYYKAAVNTQVVGYQIAKFLEQIANTTLEKENSDVRTWGPLHLVGHSLGAHICGVTAKEFKKSQDNWKVERITGLDPAQPCFKNADPAIKLHKTDAQFVDVIHTNGRLLSQIGFGLPEPVGHVDFYPNGGRSQPGCVRISAMQYSFLPIPQQTINRAICSHGRSYVYLTESLIDAANGNCTFWAQHWNLTYRDLRRLLSVPCNADTCTEMGINAENHSQKGTFFVATANSVPFCVNSTVITDEVQTQLQAEHAGHLKD